MKKIKAYTSYNEKTNTHYYHNFYEVYHAPGVGEEYEGGIVVELNEVYLDCQQDNDEVYNYNYWIAKTFRKEDYEVDLEICTTEEEKAEIDINDYYDTYYLAVEKDIVELEEDFEGFYED